MEKRERSKREESQQGREEAKKETRRLGYK